MCLFLYLFILVNNTGLTKDEFFNSLNKVTVKEYNMGQGNMPTGDYVLGQMEYIRNTMYYLTTIFAIAVSLHSSYLFGTIFGLIFGLIFIINIIIVTINGVNDVYNNTCISWVPNFK